MTRTRVIYFALILTVISCKTGSEENGIDWVYVQGGEFEQGRNQFIISPKGDTIDGFTSPNRIVQISDFYISRYEITVRQYKAFCQSTGRAMPAPLKVNAFGQVVDMEWEDHHPMLATWDEANAFAEWAGGRLPTEAEWEYAAKGGQKSKGFTYSGSNDPKEVGWVRENADSSFRAVGQLKPNELGIYDMTGNVSEWVSDWYNPEKDSLVSRIDPQGPSAGTQKISKGLSWYYASYDANGIPLKYGIHMPEVRYQSPKNTRNDGFGFRIAKDK